MRWHAFIMYRPDPKGVPFLGVFIGGTTSVDLQLPPGAQSLSGSGGKQVFDKRVDAIDEAIRYLTAERAVAEADALNRTSTPLIVRSS